MLIVPVSVNDCQQTGVPSLAWFGIVLYRVAACFPRHCTLFSTALRALFRGISTTEQFPPSLKVAENAGGTMPHRESKAQPKQTLSNKRAWVQAALRRGCAPVVR